MTGRKQLAMYGLLLESLACFIKENYGDEKWEEIRRASGIEQISFSTHQVYPENMIPRLSAKAVEVLLRFKKWPRKESFDRSTSYFLTSRRVQSFGLGSSLTSSSSNILYSSVPYVFIKKTEHKYQ